MASASIVLREDGQIALADQFLAEAKQLFSFAEAYPEMFSDDLTNEFYGSYDSDDELAWGAAWLYMATGDETYLNKAEDYAQNLVYATTSLSPPPATIGSMAATATTSSTTLDPTASVRTSLIRRTPTAR
jgi:uncharacterized protein YyaL (SSP411 family)